MSDAPSDEPSAVPGDSPSPAPTRASRATKALVAGLLVAAVVVVWFLFREQLRLDALVRHEARLQEFGRARPVLVCAAAFGIYVAVTGLSLPVAAPCTLVVGWLMRLLFGTVVGFAVALVLVNVAATAGATLSFLTSRYLLRDWVRSRFGPQVARLDEAVERDGAAALFTLRLLPVVPFVVANLGMGVTRMRWWTFWWVSQVGMLPGGAVYVMVGNSAPSLRDLAERGAGSVLQPRIVAAFVLLAAFPWLAGRILRWWRARRGTPRKFDEF
jgi:uncharacterized membrane protein YdjX (TVP38/TMEM64 family)